MKVLSITFAVAVLLFVGYVIKYQQLVNEGTVIANEQCTRVNPLISQRKKLYTDILRIAEASGSAEHYWDTTERYRTTSKKYIIQQRAWLGKEKAYMTRWDFKLFVPSYIQEIAQLQYESREADMKAQIILDQMLGRFYETGADAGEQQMNEVMQETIKRDNADKAMNKIWKEHEGKFDIRTFFIQVPQSSCPKDTI